MIYSMFTGFSSEIDRGGIRQAIKKAKEYGFEGVEFFYGARRHEEHPSLDEAREYKRALDEEGMAVPCVSVGATLIHPDKPDELNEADINGLLHLLEVTAILGARLFHHTLFMGFGYAIPEDFTLDTKRELFLRGARIIADRARELGITILYEPQGPFFNGYREFTRLFYDMKKTHENVGICCDPANSYWVDEPPYAIFEELAPHVKHVHLKDYTISDTPSEGASCSFTGKSYITQVPFDRGVTDLSRIANLLKTHSYSGAASFEDHVNVQDPEKTKALISYAKSLLE